VVAVLGGPATAAPEPGLQLAPAVGAGHPLTALLAGETADGVATPDVPARDYGRGDDQNDGGNYRETRLQRRRRRTGLAIPRPPMPAPLRQPVLPSP